MAEVKKRLVVIDGKSVFYRGYYAMPNLSTPDGTPTGGVYGFGMMALEVVKKMKPDYVCVAWDKPKTNIRRRREIYPEYKANRKPAPPDFYLQIPLLKRMLEAFGWPLYEIDDHEADDIMGTFAQQAKERGLETVLITSDKDLLQLISDDITVSILKKGLTNVEDFDLEHLREVMDMTPKEFVDYKSLRGDPSDNLPGVAGVGDKTAKQLIADYGGLDKMYEHLNDIKPSLRTKLEKAKDMAYLTKKLVILDCDVPLELNFEQADIHNLSPSDVVEVFKEFNFKTLLRQLPDSMKVDEGTNQTVNAIDDLGAGVKTEVIRTNHHLANYKFEAGKYIVLHPIFIDAQGRKVRALILSSGAKQATVFVINRELTFAQVAKKLRSYLEADNIELIGHGLKKIIKSLLYENITAGPVGHDTQVGAFLINSLIREQSLSALTQNNLGYSSSDLDSIAPDELQDKAPKIVAAIWGLYKEQINKFDDMPGVARLAKTIEWPVISVLARMEYLGISLDSLRLKKMSTELSVMISDLEQLIYGYAEMQFNIASPKQLSEVLFDRMKLPTEGIKKTKTNYSTAAQELSKLDSEHPIIRCVMNYRELTKLKNTYVDTLPEQVDNNGRVHTTFSLTTTATGRLSSRDPNLQNIPVRSKLGRKIREAFIASPGKSFVSADYSQFELRVAAVLAGDSAMIKAFNDDADIHVQTAAQMFNIQEAEVTKQQRRSAKAVNFGVMYGQGVHGLSEGTDMNFQEAKEFIDKYFQIRPKLKEYLESIEEQAKTEGYVETLYGRRRPTPDVNSSNYVVRETAKRAAINMPIQGTAADIMKIAMIKADRELNNECQILLQVHDSMLVECPTAQAQGVAAELKAIMENAVKLEVKLKVDTGISDNWGDL